MRNPYRICSLVETIARKYMQAMVDGTYFNKAMDVPSVDEASNRGEYGSAEDAVRVVGIVGIHNAQMAYFKGNVDPMGC